MNKKSMTQTSKFLSLVLRHQPEAAGITLDSHGWADVPALLGGMTAAGCPVDTALLEEIVRTDEKQRYSFNAEHTKIRANQGHSVKVDLNLRPVAPPEFLWHGTASRFLDSILREGLKPMSRQYVHLSPDTGTAEKVGSRHGRPVILQIAAQQMAQDGYLFYQAENGVWLTDTVPPQYIMNGCELRRESSSDDERR
ncbi:MAG: RNA 2'-phosphotransferase [Oscillospiraceae bacterium]|nr:RNA 2'-phosphotransferase [Oscillospiraceae bacterium]